MTVIPMHAGRMSEQQYEAARTKLRETYGDSKRQAGVRFEQELATLLYRSGWTQTELAKKEGKGQSWVSNNVVFGRFLNFIDTSIKTESLPANLSERRFYAYWKQTERGAGNERIRFLAVLKLIQSAPIATPKRPPIGDLIKQQFADGKWHPLPTIVGRVDADGDHVCATLESMQKGNYGVKVERKKVGREFHYRIFPQNKMISVAELITKLAPLVEGLKAEGKKNMATMSPGTVLHLATLAQQYLDEWAAE